MRPPRAIRALYQRVYYGWIMVAVLTVANFTQVGEFNPVLAIFIKPFGDDFGWTRAQVALGITIGSFAGGLIGPVMGPVIDRQGSRSVLVACQVIYGTALLSLTFLNGSLFHFLFAYSLGRMVIQGGTALATQVALSNWFLRYRGRAMGISSLGTRVGQAVIPPIVAAIAATTGWRWAWLFLGLSVWVMAIVPSIVFLRRRPEDLGLLPDGAPAGDQDGGSSTAGRGAHPLPAAEPASWTLREALRSRSLWLLTASSSLAFFIGAGINLHLFPYLTDAGLSLPEAVFASSIFFAISGVGGVAWGVVLERFPLRYCMGAAFVGSFLGILLLMFTSSLPLALGFAAVYGVVFGGIHTITQVMWAVYFGRENVGAISGATLPVQLVTNAAGPFFGGWMYDVHRSYTLAFAVYAAVALAAALFAFLAGPPRQRPVRAAAPVPARER